MPDTPDTPAPELAIRRALQAIADGIADGSKLTVETRVQVVNASGMVEVTGEPVTVARTEITIDGDREVIVPVLLDGGLRVPEAVYQIHERHVSEAIAYRRELLNILVDFVRGRR